MDYAFKWHNKGHEVHAINKYSGFAIASLILGILLMLPSMIPIVGILFASIGATISIIALYKTRKSNNLRGRWMAIIGTILCYMWFVSACALTYLFMSDMAAKTDGAGVTDSDGVITFKILEEDISFRFIDEDTGAILDDLTVGYAYDKENNYGMLIAIDPRERISVQVALFSGPPSLGMAATGRAPTFDEFTKSLNVFMNRQPASVVQHNIIRNLPEWTGNFLTITSTAMLVAKAIEREGVPLTDAAKNNLYAPRRYITQEQAREELTIYNKILKKRIFFFTDPETMATRGDNLAWLKPLDYAAGVALDAAHLFVDRLDFGLCYPGEMVEVTTIADSEFYKCKRVQTNDWPMMDIESTAKDYQEQGIVKGTFELVSRDHPGLAFSIPFENGKLSASVPKSDYDVRIKSPGYKPVNIELNASSKKIDAKLETMPPIPEVRRTLQTTDPTQTAQAQITPTSEGPNLDLPSELPSAKEGDTYYYYIKGIGGTPPYFITYEQGTPYPEGIYPNSDGSFSGTPFKAGTYTFNICIEDSNWNNQVKNCKQTKIVVNSSLEVWKAKIEGIQFTCYDRSYPRDSVEIYDPVKWEFTATFTVNRSLLKAVNGGWMSGTGTFSSVSKLQSSTSPPGLCKFTGESYSGPLKVIIASEHINFEHGNRYPGGYGAGKENYLMGYSWVLDDNYYSDCRSCGADWFEVASRDGWLTVNAKTATEKEVTGGWDYGRGEYGTMKLTRIK